MFSFCYAPSFGWRWGRRRLLLYFITFMSFLNVLYNIVIRALGISMQRTKTKYTTDVTANMFAHIIYFYFHLSPCLCFSNFILFFHFSFSFVERARYALKRCRSRSHFQHSLRICVVLSKMYIHTYTCIACCCSAHYTIRLFAIPKSIFSSHFIPSNETVRWIDENGTR